MDDEERIGWLQKRLRSRIAQHAPSYDAQAIEVDLARWSMKRKDCIAELKNASGSRAKELDHDIHVCDRHLLRLRRLLDAERGVPMRPYTVVRAFDDDGR
jgi:hypothetical protein